MSFKGKFDIIAENQLVRYQNGGILTGDVVKIRKDAMKNPKVQKMLDNYKEVVKQAMETDLNLRVSSVKSVWPNSMGNYNGGDTDSAGERMVDLVIEYAPGLWRTPFTVPLEVLEVVDTGVNMAPIPDSLKRKSEVHMPKDIESMDKDRKLTKKDSKMANSEGPKSDGRDQADKPREDKRDASGKLKKESVEQKSDIEMISEMYDNMSKE